MHRYLPCLCIRPFPPRHTIQYPLFPVQEGSSLLYPPQHNKGILFNHLGPQQPQVVSSSFFLHLSHLSLQCQLPSHCHTGSYDHTSDLLSPVLSFSLSQQWTRDLQMISFSPPRGRLPRKEGRVLNDFRFTQTFLWVRSQGSHSLYSTKRWSPFPTISSLIELPPSNYPPAPRTLPSLREGRGYE